MGRRKGIRDPRGKATGGKATSGEDPSPGTPDSARRKRIAMIRDQVKRGAYRVDPDAVAEKMVDDAVSKIRSRIRPQ